MAAYYNEIDPQAAQWLRNLIALGVIAPGDVDERSIVDVRPDDLRGYTQCHFFAGVGVWSYALRLAGWPDDRPVWTGSCPCQPFSVAGKGEGIEDERHLWPYWFPLIRERGPRVVFGEQVASHDGLAWLDDVHADLEGAAYTVGAVDTCSAGFGAPHIRQRFFFVADATGGRLDARRERTAPAATVGEGEREFGACTGGLVGDTSSGGRRERGDTPLAGDRGHADGANAPRGVAHPELSGAARHRRDGGPGSPQGGLWVGSADRGLVGDAAIAGPQGRLEPDLSRARRWSEGRSTPGPGASPGPVNGFWRDADWLPCRDGKVRPVEPGTFPLAHGASARVVRLRAYGNAINAEVACEFILAYRDVRAA